MGDLFESRFATSALVGVGVAVLAPALLPAVAAAARPMLRGAIKLGVTLYEKGHEAVAEAGEMMEDMIAEARSEMARGGQARVGDDTR